MLQLACKQVRYGFIKTSYIFPMEYNNCTDRLPAAATVHFLGKKWFLHSCYYKGFSCSNYNAKNVVAIIAWWQKSKMPKNGIKQHHGITQ